MQFTLFSADCIGKAANCSYPHKVLVDDASLTTVRELKEKGVEIYFEKEFI